MATRPFPRPREWSELPPALDQDDEVVARTHREVAERAALPVRIEAEREVRRRLMAEIVPHAARHGPARRKAG